MIKKVILRNTCTMFNTQNHCLKHYVLVLFRLSHFLFVLSSKKLFVALLPQLLRALLNLIFCSFWWMLEHYDTCGHKCQVLLMGKMKMYCPLIFFLIYVLVLAIGY